jgi:hypothetical protein
MSERLSNVSEVLFRQVHPDLAKHYGLQAYPGAVLKAIDPVAQAVVV